MSYSPPRTVDDAALVNDGDRKQIATADDGTHNLLFEILKELQEIKEILRDSD